LSSLRKFKQDEEGAALIEYTVLLGILVIAVVGIIGAVGTWVNSKWATLNTSIQAS
jgi:pilus assembly protein Flp/PilA